MRQKQHNKASKRNTAAFYWVMSVILGYEPLHSLLLSLAPSPPNFTYRRHGIIAAADTTNTDIGNERKRNSMHAALDA